jgi:hypothetical protein
VRIDNIFAASLVALVFGLYSFMQGFKWLKRKRLIEDIPTSKIRSIAMGLVEVFGEVVPAKRILKSPFSNNDCVYYKYTIEEYRTSGKSSRWIIVDDGEEGTYFHLKDDTGSVLVDPKGAEVDIPLDSEFKSGFGTDPPEQVKQFLRSRGISFEGFLGVNKTMRFREYFIAPKDKLYIMGTAGDNPFVKEASEQAGTEDVMIQKDEGIYYISDRSEKELLSSMKWKSISGIFGGGLLIIGSLFVILIYLGLI